MRVRQRTAALQESEQRFRLTDRAPVLIWVSDTNAACTFFNQTWLEFTGRTLAEEMGHGWAQEVHPEDKERRSGFYNSAFAARANFEMEYRLRRADGEYRWILDRGVPRFRATGEFVGYINCGIDISDRKAAEVALANQLQGALLLEQITAEIRQSLAALQIFQTTATQVGQTFGVNRCSIRGL